MTNRKTGRKDVKKTNFQTIIDNKWSANLFVYILTSRLPIGQLNKPLLTNGYCGTIHTKLGGLIGLTGPLCFYTSIILCIFYAIFEHVWNISFNKCCIDHNTLKHSIVYYLYLLTHTHTNHFHMYSLAGITKELN